MRIAVVGAGAMGSIFAVHLVEGGQDAVLVDVSRPLVEAIEARGVTIVRGDAARTVRVPVTDDPATVGAVDAVVFFVKCYDTHAAAEQARPLVADDTILASLQNGWGNGDVIADLYPAERIVVGVT